MGQNDRTQIARGAAASKLAYVTSISSCKVMNIAMYIYSIKSDLLS